MDRAVTILLRIAMALAGVVLALFFGLIYFIADCGAGCAARGEHAPIFVALGVGAALVAASATMGGDWRRALGWALLVGGAVAGAAAIFGLTRGDGGWPTWAALAVGIAAAAPGVWAMRRRRSESGGASPDTRR